MGLRGGAAGELIHRLARLRAHEASRAESPRLAINQDFPAPADGRCPSRSGQAPLPATNLRRLRGDQPGVGARSAIRRRQLLLVIHHLFLRVT